MLAVLVFSTSRATERISDCEMRIAELICRAKTTGLIREFGRAPFFSNAQSASEIASRPAHSYLTLKRDSFRIIWIDVHCAGSVLSGFAEIPAFQEDSTKQDVGVD